MFFKHNILRVTNLFLLLVCIEAFPGKLKILPGLAFYRTEDSRGGEPDNPLTDNDKKLLQTVWKIVDKGNGNSKRESARRISAHENRVPDNNNNNNQNNNNQNSNNQNNNNILKKEPKKPLQTPYSVDRHNNQNHIQSPLPQTPPLPPHAPASAHSAIGVPPSPLHPDGPPPLHPGTPITTINVYPSYPGNLNHLRRPSETPYSSGGFHAPGMSLFTPTPFSVTSMAPDTNNNEGDNAAPTESPMKYGEDVSMRPYENYPNEMEDSSAQRYEPIDNNQGINSPSPYNYPMMNNGMQQTFDSNDMINNNNPYGGQLEAQSDMTHPVYEYPPMPSARTYYGNSQNGGLEYVMQKATPSPQAMDDMIRSMHRDSSRMGRSQY